MPKKFKVQDLSRNGALPVYAVVDCRQPVEGIFCTSSKKENAYAACDALNKFYRPVYSELDIFCDSMKKLSDVKREMDDRMPF